ncbi:MAG: glycerophosphodiester phosphodiesterase [Actinomycetia bacterium]|nr:glycerophosphodiester phosphodiesterase [Actinomycetes bacterium]
MGSGRVQVIGHRGASDEAPENTMAAFKRALSLGADGIEFDVQLTRDGHAVVVHDAMLDRTTSGSGPVFEATLEEVRSLDAGSWFDPRFSGERVPTLDEVLALPAHVFELEIKTWGRAVLDSVLEAVDRAGVFERVKFTGWNHSMLCRLKARRPEATLGLFAQQPQPWMNEAVFERYVVGTAETAGFDIAHVYAGAITVGIANGLRESGYLVHANDAAGRDEVQRALDLSVHSVCLNDVALAMSMLG